MSKTQAAPSSKAKAKGPTKAQIAKSEKLFGKEAPLEEPKGDVQPVTEDQRKGERRANVDSMAFAVQQLSTPVAPSPSLETPPAAREQFNKELEELKAKYNITGPAAKVKPQRADKVQQNGITRPAANTLCGKIWEAADQITNSQHGAVATISALKGDPATKDVNEHTIKTQYARWRAFNGVSGRLPRINAVHEEKAAWNPGFGTLPKF